MMNRLLAIFGVCFLVSCGSVQKVAVDSTASVLFKASNEIETESNWENFRRGVPANLKLIEGLLYLEPTNTRLLASLIKGYDSYGFVVSETLYLEDFYGESNNTENREQSIFHYTRAMKYGVEYLNLFGIKYEELMKKVSEDNGVYALMESKLKADQETLESIFFTAHALGSLINLQKNNQEMVAQMPVVKGMLDWVCTKNPDINFGMCDLLYGVYEASRPKMLGGNPELAKKYFTGAISKRPHNWLSRVVYLQHYVIPMMDEELYSEEKKNLEVALLKHRDEMSWKPRANTDQSFEEKRLRLYQTLAIKRYEIIKKFEKKIF